jgi:hypothetical protein
MKRMFKHIQTQTHTHVHAHTNACAHVHTHTHTHTHTYNSTGALMMKWIDIGNSDTASLGFKVGKGCLNSNTTHIK